MIGENVTSDGVVVGVAWFPTIWYQASRPVPTDGDSDPVAPLLWGKTSHDRSHAN